MIERYCAAANCGASKILGAGLMVSITIDPAPFLFLRGCAKWSDPGEGGRKKAMFLEEALAANCARFLGKWNQNE